MAISMADWFLDELGSDEGYISPGSEAGADDFLFYGGLDLDEGSPDNEVGALAEAFGRKFTTGASSTKSKKEEKKVVAKTSSFEKNVAEVPVFYFQKRSEPWFLQVGPTWKFQASPGLESIRHSRAGIPEHATPDRFLRRRHVQGTASALRLEKRRRRPH